MEDAGPETLLHGDLWPKNVFLSTTDGAQRARLIDWDHVARPLQLRPLHFPVRSAARSGRGCSSATAPPAERAGRRLPEPGS